MGMLPAGCLARQHWVGVRDALPGPSLVHFCQVHTRRVLPLLWMEPEVSVSSGHTFQGHLFWVVLGTRK